MYRVFTPALVAVAMIAVPGLTAAGVIMCPAPMSLPLTTNLTVSDKRAELSGVLIGPDRLITISNEGLDDKERQHKLQIFKGSVINGFRHHRDADLFKASKGDCKDADFEALAFHDETFFAITSHSTNRKKPKRDKAIAENRRRLARAGIEKCNSRYQLIKFELSASGNVEPVRRTSLRDFIAAHPVLGPFADIPNKENGVDIEGLAATEDGLFVGFRGPVLRENFVPVLKLSRKLSRKSQKKAETLFVNLGGRGIRGMASNPDGGFVILAGPNGDEGQSFAIYDWDGRDQVFGEHRVLDNVKPLCDLGHFDAVKPESIAVLRKTAQGLPIVLVYDGATKRADGSLALKAELRILEDLAQ